MFNVKKTPMVSDEHEKQLKTKSPPLFSYEVASVARSELMQKNNLYDKQDEDDEDGIQQKSSPLLSEQESTYCGIKASKFTSIIMHILLYRYCYFDVGNNIVDYNVIRNKNTSLN